MTAEPTLSVLLPTYNAAAFLPSTLESLLAQRFQDLEIILADDASTDNTEAIVAPYLGERVRYVRLPQNSGGPSKPRNVAAEHARGRLIALCDSDDLVHPDKYARAVGVLDELPTADFLFGDCALIDDLGTVFQPSFLEDYRSFRRHLRPSGLPRVSLLDGRDAYAELICADFIAVSGAMFRRRLFEDVGMFDPSLAFAEAPDFWLRVARAGKTFAFVDEIGHQYRQRAGNMTSRGLLNYPFRIAMLEKQWPYIGSSQSAAGRLLSATLAETINDYAWGLRQIGQPRAAMHVYRRSLAYALRWPAARGYGLAMVKTLTGGRDDGDRR